MLTPGLRLPAGRHGRGLTSAARPGLTTSRDAYCHSLVVISLQKGHSSFPCALLRAKLARRKMVLSKNRTMRSICVASVALCASLCGCGRDPLIRKMTPPEDEATARKEVDLLRQRQFAKIVGDLDPGILNSGISDTLAQMADMLPADEPKSSKVVGVNVFHGDGISTDTLTLEYEFPDAWVLADVTIQRKSETATISGFHVRRIPDSLENTNRFTLIPKGPTQLLVLLLAAVALIFSLYALAECIRSEKGKRRWFWAFVVLFGVMRFAVNWTTGEWAFTFLHVGVPCATASAAPYGPWIMGVYFPLGAILYLLGRRSGPPSSFSQLSAPSKAEQPHGPVPPEGAA